MGIIREIALDTETTGFEPSQGHRIIEIGCVEMVNRLPTGRHLHLYINPERDVPQEAVDVHGLTQDFLLDKPVFAAIADEFLNFIGDSQLVIHNAPFDMKFLNAELTHIRRNNIPMSQAFDTLQEARKRFPGSPASLDALCKRFGIDNTERTLHGALLDAELLAAMYLELMGGAQTGLDLSQQAGNKKEQSSTIESNFQKRDTLLQPRPHAPTEEELAAHEAFFTGKINNSLWASG